MAYQGLSLRREAKQFMIDMINKAISAIQARWYEMQKRYEEAS